MESFTPIASGVSLQPGVSLMPYGTALTASFFPGCVSRHVCYAAIIVYFQRLGGAPESDQSHIAVVPHGAGTDDFLGVALQNL